MKFNFQVKKYYLFINLELKNHIKKCHYNHKLELVTKEVYLSENSQVPNFKIIESELSSSSKLKKNQQLEQVKQLCKFVTCKFACQAYIIHSKYWTDVCDFLVSMI